MRWRRSDTLELPEVTGRPTQKNKKQKNYMLGLFAYLSCLLLFSTLSQPPSPWIVRSHFKSDGLCSALEEKERFYVSFSVSWKDFLKLRGFC